MVVHSITPGAQLSDQVAEVLAAEIRAGRLAVGEETTHRRHWWSSSRSAAPSSAISLRSRASSIPARQRHVREEAGYPQLRRGFAVSKQAVIQMVEVGRAEHWS